MRLIETPAGVFGFEQQEPPLPRYVVVGPDGAYWEFGDRRDMAATLAMIYGGTASDIDHWFYLPRGA